MPDFELHYSVSGGYPVIQASLALAPNGQAEMFLASSWSLPGEELDQAGWFACPLPPDIMAALSQWLTGPAAQENIFRVQAAHAGKLPFDALVRRLRLVYEGVEFKLDFSTLGRDVWVSGLDELLRRAMSALHAQPRRALRLQASLMRENGALIPAFQVTLLGSEAASLLLLDSAAVPAQLCTASYNLEARVDFPGGGCAWNPQSITQVPPAHWLNLLEQGRLPAQIALAPPHTVLQLPLPALAQPADETGLYFSGALTLGLSGVENTWRRVTLQTLRRPLAEMQAYTA